ncbi:MAG: septation protein IspZ [Alphaproteobacteria bacterium]|nr:septation protein IspZ [Alphaproteobacteria bacterium]
MAFLRALVPILRDLLSTLVFVGLFWISGDIFLAAALGIALGISQTLWMRLAKRPIGALQWISLFLVTVFGMTTIVTRNPHFIMVKPTLVWLCVGGMMLRRDWMAPYLPPVVTENLEDRHIVRAGYAWAALMFALAVMNLLVAFMASPRFWSVYALVGPAVAQIALLAALYFKFRKQIRARTASAAPAAS